MPKSRKKSKKSKKTRNRRGTIKGFFKKIPVFQAKNRHLYHGKRSFFTKFFKKKVAVFLGQKGQNGHGMFVNYQSFNFLLLNLKKFYKNRLFFIILENS